MNGPSPADHAALTQLVASYAAAVDQRDWTGVADLFTPDAVLVMPDPPRSLTPAVEAAGPDAIVAAMSQLTAFARTFHHVTGSVWTPDGPGSVLGRTTSEAHHVEDSAEPRSWVWHVVYQDRCVRDGLGWLFVRRELTVAMIEARPLAWVLPFDGPPA